MGISLEIHVDFRQPAFGGLLIKPVVGRFGERRAMAFGIAAGVLGFLAMATAPTALLFWATMPIMALWGFISPSAQGLMSRRVGASEQGQLQGANSSLMAVSSLIAPALFTLTFARGIAAGGWDLPGAPYFVAALLLALGGGVAWLATRPTDELDRDAPRHGVP